MIMGGCRSVSDIRGSQERTGSGLPGAELRQLAERLRRGKFGADDLAAFLKDFDRHEAGTLLEQ